MVSHACSTREPRTAPNAIPKEGASGARDSDQRSAPTAAAATPATSDDDVLYTVDHVLCPSHFDNACHIDDKRRPHRWATGAAGLDWSAPHGMVLAKLSLVDGHWVADVWFAPGEEGDPLVDDKTGLQRPPSPIATVNTGVTADQRKFEDEAITGLAYTPEGFVVVAGRSLDIAGLNHEERTLEGRFYQWNAASRRFELTNTVRMTSEWQGSTKVRRRVD